jgi:hypothetical protein
MNDLLFSEATRLLLEDKFGLREIQFSDTLTNWMEAKQELSDYEHEALQNLRELLDLNVDSWNEQELSLHFIGPVFSIFRFTVPYKFNLFAERLLSAKVGDTRLHGEPDGIIASGYREPNVPFFTFHEYKKSVDSTGDPAGQALAAMLAGQALNQNSNLIYGCYVIGRNWYFMTLEGKEYCISNGHNALQDDIFAIGRILKELKHRLLVLTA